MAYTVIRAEDQTFESPSWSGESSGRTLIELRLRANLQHSQANLWRFPPGAHGRRHREPLQEEVFCVVEGVLTMLLGEPVERFTLTPRSLVVVEPRTPIQLRNDTDSDVFFIAYGAPDEPSDYKAEILPDA
jgi:quercetin dioxygenase-like cupin family protein